MDMSWTQLAATTEAVTHFITLKCPEIPEWTVGNAIVIASSRYDPYEAEVRTITSITGDNIAVNGPLQHTDKVSWVISHEDVTGRHIEDGVTMSAEVGLLTRSIVVQGGKSEELLEYHHYSCRVLIGQYSYKNFEYNGRVQFDSAKLPYCGQGGYFAPRDSRYSIAFKDMSDGSHSSYIHQCSSHHGFNTAIGLHRSNRVVLEDNVIYCTTDSSVKTGGSENITSRKLAMLTSTNQPNDLYEDTHADCRATYIVNATNELKGNVAAGITHIGIRFTGEAYRVYQTLTEDSVS